MVLQVRERLALQNACFYQELQQVRLEQKISNFSSLKLNSVAPDEFSNVVSNLASGFWALAWRGGGFLGVRLQKLEQQTPMGAGSTAAQIPDDLWHERD